MSNNSSEMFGAFRSSRWNPSIRKECEHRGEGDLGPTKRGGLTSISWWHVWESRHQLIDSPWRLSRWRNSDSGRQHAIVPRHTIQQREQWHRGTRVTACGRLQPSLSLLIEPANRRVCRASAMTRPLAHKLDNRNVDKLKSDTSAEVFKVSKVQQCSLSDVKYVFGFSDTNLFYYFY